MAANPHATGPGARLLEHEYRELSEIFHELQQDLTAGKPLADAARLLAALRQIALTHFGLQESLLAASRYPGLAVHRLEHQWLVEQIEALAARARVCRIAPNDQTLNFLVHSFLSHVQHADAESSRWLTTAQPVPSAQQGPPLASGPLHSIRKL